MMRATGSYGVLEEDVAAFKSNPAQLQDVTEFVDALILQAQKDAEARLKLNGKNRQNSQNEEIELGSLKRRLGRARTFMVRMLDALCNCTQTAATAARTRTINLTKR